MITNGNKKFRMKSANLKKIFAVLFTAVLCFAGFLVYKRIVAACNEEYPLRGSGYNPEVHFERVMAEDQNGVSPEGDDSFVSPGK
jgi:hypothetical protein